MRTNRRALVRTANVTESMAYKVFLESRRFAANPRAPPHGDDKAVRKSHREEEKQADIHPLPGCRDLKVA